MAHVRGTTLALAAAPLPGRPLDPDVTVETASEALRVLSDAILATDSPALVTRYRVAQDRWLDALSQLTTAH